MQLFVVNDGKSLEVEVVDSELTPERYEQERPVKVERVIELPLMVRYKGTNVLIREVLHALMNLGSKSEGNINKTIETLVTAAWHDGRQSVQQNSDRIHEDGIVESEKVDPESITAFARNIFPEGDVRFGIWNRLMECLQEGQHSSDQDIADLLVQLDPRQRQILDLRFRAGMTFKRIGELFRIHLSTAQQSQNRALAKLQELVEKKGNQA